MSRPLRSLVGGPPKTFKKALAAHQRGDLAKTEALCLAVLKTDPNYFDALHLLAIVQSRMGRHVAALEIFNKAIKLYPNNAELINNRAGALNGVKHYEQALAGYEKAIKLRPDYADAHNNRGCVLLEMRRYEEALSSYSRALLLDPDNPEYINNLGMTLTKLRRYADALDCYEEALALRPDYLEALVNRGVTLNDISRFEEALTCFDKTPAQDADCIEVLLSRAHALNGLNRFEEALSVYDRVLSLYPDRHEVFLRRGSALSKLKVFDEAFKSYDKALALNVDRADVFVSRAMTLMEMGRMDEAIGAVEHALAVRPHSAEIHHAKALVLMVAERWAEAIANFRKAVELRGDYSEAAWNLGYLLLLLGNFAEGWRHYEVRRLRTTWTKLKGPEWSGQSLEGKTLLLYAEQGLGDALQFVRFVRVVARMGARPILGVYAPVAALFSMMDEKPGIVRHGEAVPDCDYHAPLMSLPFILGLDETTIPAETPYLRADPERIERWKARLPQARFRIGIAWQGSKTDPTRWAPLAAFAPLSCVPGVALISLQKTDGLEQLKELPSGMQVETLGLHFDAGPNAFLDTAAVMMNLDLIVTIDTAIAHLAGALGRPVWIALKRVPDWRWMLERSDSPWYPTARLFHQRQTGEWTAMMEEMAAALVQLVTAKIAKSESSHD